MATQPRIKTRSRLPQTGRVLPFTLAASDRLRANRYNSDLAYRIFMRGVWTVIAVIFIALAVAR